MNAEKRVNSKQRTIGGVVLTIHLLPFVIIFLQMATGAGGQARKAGRAVKNMFKLRFAGERIQREKFDGKYMIVNTVWKISIGKGQRLLQAGNAGPVPNE